MLSSHAMPRGLVIGLLAATLVLASRAALAADGGSALDATTLDASAHDAARSVDASPAKDAPSDAPHGEDAKPAVVTDAAHNCSAIGEPCAAGVACCDDGAYCGSFGGVGTSLVCGQDTSNTLPTSSCAVGPASRLDEATLLVVLGAFAVVRRGRRRRSK